MFLIESDGELRTRTSVGRLVAIVMTSLSEKLNLSRVATTE